MKRTLLAMIAASSVAIAAPTFGQSASSTTADAKDMTITGCLQKNKSGGFWLTESRGSVAPSASSASTTAPNSASSTTGSSASTTATGTSGRAASTTGDKDLRSAEAHHLWNLENGHDLDKYVNQRIEVTGRAKNSTSGDELKGTKGHEMDARDFDVKSVKPIAGSCS